MKTLIAAFLLALLAIVGAFLSLSLIGVDHAIAGPIATVIIGGVPYIRESLDKQLAARARPQGIPVLSLDQFGLPPRRMVFYGFLILFGAMQFASGFGAVLAGVLGVGVGIEKITMAIAGTSVLVVWPTVFLVGRWVGRRSISNGLLSVFLIGLLARIAMTLVDFAILSYEDLTSYLSQFYGKGSAVWQGVQQIVSGVVLFFVLGALGYWRGRRQLLGSYLSYLLRNVPDETRRAIVELAFEEARRVSGSMATSQPPNAAVESNASQGARPSP